MKVNCKFYILFIFAGTALQSVRAQVNQTFDNFMKEKNQQFQNFINSKQKEFDEFRRKKNEEFARFMEQGSWEVYDKKAAEKRPKEKDVPPVVYDEKYHQNKKERQQVIEFVPYENPKPQPQPKPIVPVIENDESNDYSTFTYYGTKMQARWGDLNSFKLGLIDDKTLANAFRKLTDKKYNNLLNDCLLLREKYALCDWAYYKMLEILAETVCGKQTNEAVFLQGVLFQQSGYTMRFARDNRTNHLCLLVKIKGHAFDYKSMEVDGKQFFIFKDTNGQQLSVCKIAYQDEQDMQMALDRLPRLEFNLSKIRSINSLSYNIKVTNGVNKNLIGFMQDYPCTYDGKNIMTRWVNYANTPVSEEVLLQLYPQMKERLQNVNELMAVNMLLNWVQTGFEYELDDKVWGHDRAFFAEETLFYPFSDCEDRAILFSHLVRDLLGLDVVLVYYPGHLSAAVCFNGNVNGDYLMLGEKKFTIADPCYTRARVGCTMPGMDNKIAKVILCQR